MIKRKHPRINVTGTVYKKVRPECEMKGQGTGEGTNDSSSKMLNLAWNRKF